MLRQIFRAGALVMAALPAWAEDSALVLSVEDYSNLDDLRGGVTANATIDAFRAAGFRIFARDDADSAGIAIQAERFLGLSSGADRLVAVLSGRFVTDGKRTWMLSRQAADINLLSLSDHGLSVESVMTILSQTPGQAVLVLVTDSGDNGVRYSPLLQGGIGPIDIPQGVTVIRGRGAEAERLVRQTITQPGADVMAAIDDTSRLSVSGFAPERLVMTRRADMRDEDDVGDATGGNSNTGGGVSIIERSEWEKARTTDTVASYQRYLDMFPLGEYVPEARRSLEDLRNDPFRQARLTEEALNLNRSERRAIQADLNVLNYNTRGVDGIFGPGTRGAIRNWQQQNGFAQTGFITENQIVRLDGQALRRTVELEAEAERQRQAEEQRDRAFWDETGSDGREAGLRAYLNRYPDGLFAAEAKDQLNQIEQRKLNAARAEERQAWDRARNTNTVNAYQRYLRQYPQGAFKDAAEARIEAAQQSDQDRSSRADARRGEEALGLDPVFSRLVEARLQQLGLNPGTIDGQFDADTRRAIRNFQRDRDLKRTGFLDADTVSRLLRIGDR